MPIRVLHRRSIRKQTHVAKRLEVDVYIGGGLLTLIVVILLLVLLF